MASLTIDTGKLKQRFSTSSPAYPKILQFVGMVGILFYAVGPIFFPDAPIRQPELLPVYTLMLGLGELLKSGPKEKNNDAANSKK